MIVHLPQELSEKLVRTLKELALDGRCRTDIRRRLHIEHHAFEEPPATDPHAQIKQRLAEVNPPLAMAIANIGRSEQEFRPHVMPTLDPATDQALDILETIASIELPGDLRDFYKRVGDGGVGPGTGIYPHGGVLERYRWSVGCPVGPQGQEWPMQLLPICGDWDATSIDLNSGRLIYWDIGELDIDSEDPQSAPWDQSFKLVAESLEQWLTHWLEVSGIPLVSGPLPKVPGQPQPSVESLAGTGRGGASYLQRYLDGECEAVWSDLVELGDRVFEEAVHSDAMAVARETMQRARRNLEKIVQKLDGISYNFAGWSSRGPAIRDPAVFSAAPADAAGLIARCEQETGAALPFALRAWYEQVGSISLIGSHEILNPRDRGQQLLADPLVILPLEDLLDQLADIPAEERTECAEMIIAPDDLTKADISGAFYHVRLPSAGADLAFDDWHRTTFVNYLRTAFRWGGFPGWERSPDPPQPLLAYLTEGLEQI